MTINELFDLCKNINRKTSFSIYESVEDFNNCTPNFETYDNPKAIPAYIRNKPVGVFEISRHSNTCFIGIDA